MAESDELFTAIKRIEGRIDSIDFTLEQVLGCLPKEQLWAKIKPVLSQKNVKRVFLILDTPCSQAQILERLVENGEPISQPTISRCLSKLSEMGIVKVVDVRERESIYAKTAMDRLLDITERLLGESREQ
jgi:DNA-binding transcriptional ArsR family regulator